MLTTYLRMWGVIGLGSFSTNLGLLRMCISRQSVAKSLIGNLVLSGITVVHRQRWGRPYPNPMDFGLKIGSFLSSSLLMKLGVINIIQYSFRGVSTMHGVLIKPLVLFG
ncbi:hypothetical protein RHMOL_Rhmol09G0186900 [Rhododendron molle]|uniref:Uncharacterized protein n=1 Tax=Rhododendron molle TaxID=49168 RepID=A0ACC0MFZ0_RHOML|nr:hypothetical protein RHMOL_Rhmol09G0186900 [Rhododendron molle]